MCVMVGVMVRENGRVRSWWRGHDTKVYARSLWSKSAVTTMKAFESGGYRKHYTITPGGRKGHPTLQASYSAGYIAITTEAAVPDRAVIARQRRATQGSIFRLC